MKYQEIISLLASIGAIGLIAGTLFLVIDFVKNIRTIRKLKKEVQQ